MNERLSECLAENRRDALVSHHLHTAAPVLEITPGTSKKVTTADELYEYLLLDTQISAKVKTSRIAEAIASVQLYMHRVRQDVDPGADEEALAGAMSDTGYFSLWNAYNSRYGTWAGLQRLLNYPASYIEPELRYEKSAIFRKMMDGLNQGRLTSERANEAFQTFAHDVADAMDIIAIDGFQIGPNVDSPAYFLGYRGDKYYWRQSRGKTDELASHWTDWLEVGATITAFNSIIERPSIVWFNEAVHVCWFEFRDAGISVDADSGAQPSPPPKTKKETILSIAMLRHDGQWRQRSHRLQISNGHDGVAHAYVTTVGNQGGSEPLLIYTNAGGTGQAPSIMLDQSLNFLTSKPEDFVANLTKPGFSSRLVRRALATTSDKKVKLVLTSPIDGVHDFSIENKDNKHSLCTAKLDDTYVMSVHMQVDGGHKVFHLYTQELDMSVAIEVPFSELLAADSTWVEEGTEYLGPRYPLALDVTSWEDSGANSLYINRSHELPGYTRLVKPGAVNIAAFGTSSGRLIRGALPRGLPWLLSYEMQSTPADPAVTASAGPTPIPFIGAMGLYAWELFFHAPFHIACRMIDEQRFDEAETWLGYILSPAGFREPASGVPLNDNAGRPLFWNVRPLQEDTAWNAPSSDYVGDDPDAVAMNDPMHYKLAVYLRWLKMLMDRGDVAYRQQTRDAMGEAKMWYVRAMQLLGKRPYVRKLLPEQWDDPTLAQAIPGSNAALRSLAAGLNDRFPDLPATHPSHVPTANNGFIPPIDTGTLQWWDRFELRLHNLRHGLSLDGQPLLLPLYETPADPRELQNRRQTSGAGGTGSLPTTRPPIHRFVVLLDRARQAVQQLTQFGALLQSVLERRDADALGLMVQTQQLAISRLARGVHEENIAVLQHTVEASRQARAGAEKRRNHYRTLLDEGQSTLETKALDMRGKAIGDREAAQNYATVAAILDTVPNMYIAGLAAGVGGIVFSSLAHGGVIGSEFKAASRENDAVVADISASHQRRAQEWELAHDQADRDVLTLGEQVESQQAQLTVARRQLAQLEQEQVYSQAVLDTLGTRFTSQALFTWQAGRMSTLYYQFYDATLGLCAWARQAHEFETGDSTAYIMPSVWDDAHQGLLAGEGLALGLARLERAHLDMDQRALEIVRTVSVNGLAGGNLAERIGKELEAANPAATAEGNDDSVVVRKQNDCLTVVFNLSDAGIPADYPTSLVSDGRRRIKTVAVTLPALLGPYEDVRALLSIAGDPKYPMPPGCEKIALSRGLSDSGQFSLLLNDDRYLPFEGIPVDEAKVTLAFPLGTAGRSQEDMLRSITDIILHVYYTIRPDRNAGVN